MPFSGCVDAVSGLLWGRRSQTHPCKGGARGEAEERAMRCENWLKAVAGSLCRETEWNTNSGAAVRMTGENATTATACGTRVCSGAGVTAQGQSPTWQLPEWAALREVSPRGERQAQAAGWVTQHAFAIGAVSALSLQEARAGVQAASVGNASSSQIARCRIMCRVAIISSYTEVERWMLLIHFTTVKV